MSTEAQIILLDADFRRRAAISHCLADSGIYVEPLEDMRELAAHWPAAGIILAHDREGCIAALMEQMRQSGEWLPVIAFSERPAPAAVVAAVLEGAIHYLSWPFADGELVEALRLTHARAQELGRARLRHAAARSRIERLTRREREVLSGIANGLSNRLIGAQLAISPRTVEIHRANLLNKMGANHTSEAIRIAIEACMPG